MSLTLTKRLATSALAAVVGGSLVGAAAALPAVAKDFTVQADYSKPLKLERAAATIVVGNPSVADVTVQDGTLLFVLGKTYGRTNVIALDSAGKEIVSLDVTVTSGRATDVTLHRGSAQHSYACAPRCEPTLTVGDFPESFQALSGQANSKIGVGEGAAQAANSASE